MSASLPRVTLGPNTFDDGPTVVQLGPVQAKIMAVLIEDFPAFVSTSDLVARVYRANEPEWADGSIIATVHALREKLAPTRWGIKSLHSRGYALIPSAPEGAPAPWGMTMQRVDGWLGRLGPDHWRHGDPYRAVVFADLLPDGRVALIGACSRGRVPVSEWQAALATFERETGITVAFWDRIEGGITRRVERRESMSKDYVKWTMERGRGDEVMQRLTAVQFGTDEDSDRLQEASVNAAVGMGFADLQAKRERNGTATGKGK